MDSYNVGELMQLVHGTEKQECVVCCINPLYIAAVVDGDYIIFSEDDMTESGLLLVPAAVDYVAPELGADDFGGSDLQVLSTKMDKDSWHTVTSSGTVTLTATAAIQTAVCSELLGWIEQFGSTFKGVEAWLIWATGVRKLGVNSSKFIPGYVRTSGVAVQPTLMDPCYN